MPESSSWDSFVAGCGWPRVIPLRKTTSPCSLVTNPDVELFFFRGVQFFFLCTGHKQRRAAAIRLRFIDADDFPFVGRDQQKFDDRAIVHLWPHAGDYILGHHAVSCLATRKVAFSSHSAGTEAFPSATS